MPTEPGPTPEQQPTAPVEGATIPEQPTAAAPIRKKLPIVFLLAGVVLLFGITNLVSLVRAKKEVHKSALPLRPSTADPQQVTSFENQQAMDAAKAAEEQRRREQLAAQLDALQSPGPESDKAPAMTAAQRSAIYGDHNPNAPSRISGLSEAQAEAKQKRLARERQELEAQNSDTVAVDFARPTEGKAKADGTATDSTSSAETDSPTLAALMAATRGITAPGVAAKSAAPQGPAVPAPAPGGDQQPNEGQPSVKPVKAEARDAAISKYDFDTYDGKLYRVFEGTVLEGVVTNHIDGGFNGPILIMLTTDYYSHDHEQLLFPQGTRLIGTVQSVASGQQRKLFVVFHRAVCPDGFSVSLDNFLGLDPLGTTGLATKVDHGYFQAFAAAAAIGGLGGLAQIGNGGIGLLGADPSVEIRNGITEQTNQEAIHILDRFLNRLPVITLKEGSRARVYIGRDILVPSYADHRVDPTL